VLFETWADLIAGLDRALAFARGVGLDPVFDRGRFGVFRARLAELDAIFQNDGSRAAFGRFERELEANAVALTESQELATIIPFLESIPAGPASRKLHVALQGPELPSDENQNSNAARNTMFELNLAARMYRAGLDVVAPFERRKPSLRASLKSTWLLVVRRARGLPRRQPMDDSAPREG
jgi:hypothetical protein